MARRVEDPEMVQRIFLGLDGEHDDGQEVLVSVREGGLGSTSASVDVVLTDATTNETAIFRVEISRPDSEDDDYDGEEG